MQKDSVAAPAVLTAGRFKAARLQERGRDQRCSTEQNRHSGRQVKLSN